MAGRRRLERARCGRRPSVLLPQPRAGPRSPRAEPGKVTAAPRVLPGFGEGCPCRHLQLNLDTSPPTSAPSNFVRSVCRCQASTVKEFVGEPRPGVATKYRRGRSPRSPRPARTGRTEAELAGERRGGRGGRRRARRGGLLRPKKPSLDWKKETLLARAIRTRRGRTNRSSLHFHRTHRDSRSMRTRQEHDRSNSRGRVVFLTPLERVLVGVLGSDVRDRRRFSRRDWRARARGGDDVLEDEQRFSPRPGSGRVRAWAPGISIRSRTP